MLEPYILYTLLPTMGKAVDKKSPDKTNSRRVMVSGQTVGCIKE